MPIALVCTAAALVGLIVDWRRKNDESLAWAGAITGTATLGPYVPFYGTILLMVSLFATSEFIPLRNEGALLALLLLVFFSAWLTRALALLFHFQLLTLAIGSGSRAQVRAMRSNGSISRRGDVCLS